MPDTSCNRLLAKVMHTVIAKRSDLAASVATIGYISTENANALSRISVSCKL